MSYLFIYLFIHFLCMSSFISSFIYLFIVAFANIDGTELTYTLCVAGNHCKPETAQVTLLSEPLKRYDAKRQILASFFSLPMAANVDLMPNIVLLQGFEMCCSFAFFPEFCLYVGTVMSCPLT